MAHRRKCRLWVSCRDPTLVTERQLNPSKLTVRRRRQSFAECPRPISRAWMTARAPFPSLRRAPSGTLAGRSSLQRAAANRRFRFAGRQVSCGVWAATRDRNTSKRRSTGPRGPNRACAATRAPSPNRNSSSASNSGSRSPASRPGLLPLRNRQLVSNAGARPDSCAASQKPVFCAGK
jgi:hypothetical protein